MNKLIIYSAIAGLFIFSFGVGYTVCDRQWHNKYPIAQLDAYQNYVDKTEKFIDEIYDLYPIDDTIGEGDAVQEYYEARESIGLECPL